MYMVYAFIYLSETVWPCNTQYICIILVQHIILFSNLPFCCSVYLYQFGKHPTSVHIEIHANPSLILPSPQNVPVSIRFYMLIRFVPEIVQHQKQCKHSKLGQQLLKVSKFQKENMKSSHFPKFERKNLKNSVLSIQDRIFQIFSFRFWEV